MPVLSVTQSGCVPELSESRYLCTSKTSLPTPPAGSVTLSRYGPASVGSVAALEYEEPGMRMTFEVAPAARMAFTAAWTESAHDWRLGMSCGSFMMPKMTADLSAATFQKSGSTHP
jgi:hypothetical protein